MFRLRLSRPTLALFTMTIFALSACASSPSKQGGQVAETLEFWAVETKPELIKSVAPVYPEIARKAGLEGMVFVRFSVRTDGRVGEVQVLRGPEIFREATITSAKQYVFKPATQNGEPIEVWLSRSIAFRLE